MSYDIKALHLDDDSPEGRAVRTIVAREGVTPEDAVRFALRKAVRDPKAIIGGFSSPADAAILDEAMAFVHENRERTTRDYSPIDFDEE